MSFMPLRLARADDEGPVRVRPQGHRARPVGDRHGVRGRACCSSPRTRASTLHKISEIYDRIAFAGVGKYSEFEDLRIAGDPARRPARLLRTAART